MTTTLKLAPCASVEKPTGDVAYLRIPLTLSAMRSLLCFLEKAYGKNCVCTEDPKGWLKVSTSRKAANAAEGEGK